MRSAASLPQADRAEKEAVRHLDVDGTGYLTNEQLMQGYKEFLGDDPDAAGNWSVGQY